MANNGNELRQRKDNVSTPSKTIQSKVELEDSSSRMISVIDILRIFLTIIIGTLALSYYLTSGESFTFNKKPWWTDIRQVKAYISGELVLTPAQLSAYDGSNPDTPIYLAINGTIFDVTAGRHTYGPGGSYSFFAGRDATRAFVTGCFAEDLTGDLRGAELAYLPIEDDPEEVLTSAERKIRAEKEKREARQRAMGEVERWYSFYLKSHKYFKVGRVLEDKNPGEPPKLCKASQKGRPRRSIINKNKKNKEATEQKQSAPGKPVQ